MTFVKRKSRRSTNENYYAFIELIMGSFKTESFCFWFKLIRPEHSFSIERVMRISYTFYLSPNPRGDEKSNTCVLLLGFRVLGPLAQNGVFSHLPLNTQRRPFLKLCSFSTKR